MVHASLGRVVLALIAATAIVACASSTSSQSSRPRRSKEDRLIAIAREIEKLKPVCPQLVEFNPSRHLDLRRQQIFYAYHVDQSLNPAPDGMVVRISMDTLERAPGLEYLPRYASVDVLDGKAVPQCYRLVEEICKRELS